VPDARQVTCEREDPRTVLFVEVDLLAATNLGVLAFGSLYLLQPLLPVALERAGHHAVVGIDGLVAALGEQRVVADPLQPQLPLAVDLLGLPFGLACDREGELDLRRLSGAKE
jgi:hypothetical protein